MATQSRPVSTLASTPGPKQEVVFLRKCQPYLRLVSTLLAVITCLSGVAFEARQTRDAVETANRQLLAKQEEMLREQRKGLETAWRDALGKVGFDEQSLLSTAFLMETFDAKDNVFRDSARRIVQTVLDDTNRPETFDLVLWNMLSNLKDQDDQTAVLAVGHTLGVELRMMYERAIKDRNFGDHSEFRDFLQNPVRFYPAKSQAGELDRTLMLIWKLETFSDGVACLMNTVNAECQHPASLRASDLKEEILLTHEALSPELPKDAVLVTKCRISRDFQHGQLTCDADPD